MEALVALAVFFPFFVWQANNAKLKPAMAQTIGFIIETAG
jgi:hypothetical protein